MITKDARTIATKKAIRSAVCQILSSGHPDNFTIKSVAAKSGSSEKTVRGYSPSAWRLLELFDSEIMAEFKKRRAIQKEELGVSGLTGDFFMR